MDIVNIISKELDVKTSQVDASIRLIDEGNTIPFIARYRKEQTGSLNDEQLRFLDERLTYLRNLIDRKETILNSIREQDKLTPKLEEEINEVMTLVELEDIYRPYKPKKRTRGMIARERGLEPLSILLLTEKDSEILAKAKNFLSDDVEDENAAIKGAMDIIAEDVSDNPEYRNFIRELSLEQARLISKKKNDDEKLTYEMYYDYEEGIDKLASHNILAINRGEKEKVLTVKLELPDDRIISYICKKLDADGKTYLTDAIKDGYQRLIQPSMERELRSKLKEEAEDQAIKVFSKNLKQLLMQPPISGKTVLGWDPAFRTGCKLAIVDKTGKVLETKVIYPTKPQEKIEESRNILKELIKKYDVDIVSLGNGTASRESEKVIADLIKDEGLKIAYVIVSEAGASVYSASKLATEEFPNFDVGQRSAASIARRLQDPLSELVKIDPKAIGVGQYQHDMDQKKLGDTLDKVVEDSVNQVGVDLNTASVALLKYVSGINQGVAKNIIAYREENGSFKDRSELLKVPKLGAKAFEQSAGFMRISNGANPLDSTGIHPESYDATIRLLEELGLSLDSIDRLREKDGKKNKKTKNIKKQKRVVKGNGSMAKLLNQALDSNVIEDRDDEFYLLNDLDSLSKKLDIGVPTLKDIIQELKKPGRDPREELPKPILKSDILEFKDLKLGMVLKGTVRNIVDFGAFVDIGVHDDGLVHISQISNKFIKHPLEILKVGDVVDVKIIDIDERRKKIGLSIKEARQ